MLQRYFCILCAVALAYCTSNRDQALRELYRDGIAYLQTTLSALQATKTADEAADAVEKSLPPLKTLVERKKALEKKYPELADTTRREQIHSQFAEFHELRKAAQELYRYGSAMALRYKNHERFMKASRTGWELLAYF
jgi:hypothetical protein